MTCEPEFNEHDGARGIEWRRSRRKTRSSPGSRDGVMVKVALQVVLSQTLKQWVVAYCRRRVSGARR